MYNSEPIHGFPKSYRIAMAILTPSQMGLLYQLTLTICHLPLATQLIELEQITVEETISDYTCYVYEVLGIRIFRKTFIFGQDSYYLYNK